MVMPVCSNLFMINCPYSKSILLRAIALKFVLTGEVTDFSGNGDDVNYFVNALKLLRDYNHENLVINIGDGAAPFRFLTAIIASSPGVEAMVVPSTQLGLRPHQELFDSLIYLGAKVCPNYYFSDDSEPLLKFVKIKGKRLSGGDVNVDASFSSQLASALLLASPLMIHPLNLKFSTQIVSLPYLDMTRRMLNMAQSGIDPLSLLEKDWSSASYFYEWALLNPGKSLEIDGLKPKRYSLQGDAICEEIFDSLGVVSQYNSSDGYVSICGDINKIQEVRKGFFELDCSNFPDLVPSLVCGLCGAGFSFRLSGVASLAFKEVNRLEILRQELAKGGWNIKVTTSSIEYKFIDRVKNKPPIIYSSHGDHRIAMSLAPLLRPSDQMKMKNTISKSFPDFYSELKKLSNL